MKILSIPKLSTELEILPINSSTEKIYAKYYPVGVQAGFPSPADDFLEQRISLDEKYITDHNSTYLIKVKGTSMYPTLHKGDILIVKAGEDLKNNQIAIISVNHTDYTAKRFDKKNKVLLADNDKFPNIELKEDDVLICLGVVKHLIRDI